MTSKRSNPNSVARAANSPQEAYVEWHAGDGYAKLSYKDESGQTQRIKLAKLQFMVLHDNLMCVGGYKEKGGDRITYSSNLARLFSDDVLKVKQRRNGDEKLIAEGPWRMIKNTVTKDYDGRFVRYLYVCLKAGSSYKLVVLKLKGLAVSEYMRFEKGKILTEEDWVVVTDTKVNNEYAQPAVLPVFDIEMATEEERNLAEEMSLKVRKWEESYFGAVRNNMEDEEIQQGPEPNVPVREQGVDDWPVAENEPVEVADDLPF